MSDDHVATPPPMQSATATPIIPTATPPQKSQNIALLIFAGTLLLLVGGAGGYYLAKNPVAILPIQQACTMEAQLCPDGSSVGRSGPSCAFAPCPSLTPTTLSVSPTAAQAYKKRLYDSTTKIIGSNTFPTEMSAIADSQLIGLRCSGYYYSDYEGKYLTEVPSSVGKPVEMTDPLFLSITKNDPKIAAILSCSTQSGATIVYYELQEGKSGGGGGMSTVAHFALVNAAGTLKDIAVIPNDGAPYFTCRSPYMLTTSNILYWGCGGGDGGFGQSSIYAINTVTATVRRVFKCSSTVDASTDRPDASSIVKCE